ncbi:hypothetical protein TNCV_403211 [Trichonephila clavipes]|nr:hypothetical protein TNCV_403211 [Trichonephila clavipes]
MLSWLKDAQADMLITFMYIQDDSLEKAHYISATARFCREAYFSNGQSEIAVLRVFRLHFDIPTQDCVPDQKCVLMCVDAFRATVNVSKEGKGPPKTIRTPENVKRVLVSIQASM